MPDYFDDPNWAKGNSAKLLRLLLTCPGYKLSVNNFTWSLPSKGLPATWLISRNQFWPA